jgi:hypothetical protein
VRHARAAGSSHRGDSFDYPSFSVSKTGNPTDVHIKKVIQERIRRRVEGLDLDADVNAVVAANVGESGQTTSVSSMSSAKAGSRAREGQDPPRK